MMEQVRPEVLWKETDASGPYQGKEAMTLGLRLFEEVKLQKGSFSVRAVGIHPGFTSLSCCVFLIKSQRLRIQGCTATAQEDIASPAQ